MSPEYLIDKMQVDQIGNWAESKGGRKDSLRDKEKGKEVTIFEINGEPAAVITKNLPSHNNGSSQPEISLKAGHIYVRQMKHSGVVLPRASQLK